jgi:hypothetical protein
MVIEVDLAAMGAPVDVAAIAAWLKEDECWSGDDSMYFNEDTAVSFRLELSGKNRLRVATATLELPRPSFVGRESLTFLVHLAKTFGLEVSTGLWSPPKPPQLDELLAHWAKKNIAAAKRSTLPRLDSSRSAAMWEWNVRVSSRQQQVDQTELELFVPRILATNTRRRGELGTAVVWVDGNPALFPQVDYVVIASDERADTFDRYELATRDAVVSALGDHLTPFDLPGTLMLRRALPPGSVRITAEPFDRSWWAPPESWLDVP